MAWYGPKQMVCPNCKKTHTTMYGDVINPIDPAFYCKDCKLSFLKALFFSWIPGQRKDKDQKQE